jgi:hypothetical protein
VGTLFPDSDEFPDDEPMPRFTVRLGSNGAIIPIAIACSLYGLCPIEIEDHSHPIHRNHEPIDYRVSALAVSSSSSSGGNVTVRSRESKPRPRLVS